MYCKTIRIFNQTIPGTAVGDDGLSMELIYEGYLIAWFATLAQPV